MAVSRARLTAMPHTVRIAPRMAERASEVCTAVCAPSLSLAPRNWDTTTPAPTAMPWLNPMSRKMGEPLEPTAASALLPTKLPTMMESAVLWMPVTAANVWEFSYTGSAAFSSFPRRCLFLDSAQQKALRFNRSGELFACSGAGVQRRSCRRAAGRVELKNAHTAS